MEGWTVDTVNDSLSDHRYLKYRLGDYVPEKALYRNLNKANWYKFNEILKDFRYDEAEDLDIAALKLQNKIREALDISCPLSASIQKKPNKWWDNSLESKRKEVMNTKMENRKAIRKEYSNMIKKAKRESWKRFCSEADKTTDVSRLVKILDGRAKKGNISTLKNQDGKILNPQESLVEFMNVHFPENEIQTDELPGEYAVNDNINTELMSYIDERKVFAAIASFGPKKASGPDDIKPIVLQHLNSEIIKIIVKLFRRSIITGYPPRCWREMKVIFLPKPGKDNYAVAKSYRPITL